MAGGNVKRPYSDARWHDDPKAKVLLCSFCQHAWPYVAGTHTMRCDAFPDGKPRFIPNETEPCNNGIGFLRGDPETLPGRTIIWPDGKAPK